MLKVGRENSLEQYASMKLSTFDIPAEDIRAEIGRISAGPEIRNSPRLQELLNYLVEEFLAGKGARIKGFTIGQAVFAAEEDFDPETNSIVRVEVGRLRRRLAEYYMTSGRDNPIVVDIPKGSYVPRFTLNPHAPEESKTPLSNHLSKLLLQNRWLAVGVLVIAVSLAFNWRYHNVLEPSVNEEMNRDQIQKQLEGSEA